RRNARPFERATRDAIRQDPPQILLTNFAMLEYLLLRPSDQTIFKHNSVNYVVFDEAHSYRGSQGIDISLLMKRFQLRCPAPIQFILTSATLGDAKDPGNKARIAAYATDLTGAAFEADDVISGEITNPFRGVDGVELTEAAVRELARITAKQITDALASPS